jgi:5-methylcytosine-specific restriction endonuclease McrA
VTNKKGIFEFILGGETDPKLLEIRVFNNATKLTAYKQQTETAKSNNVSNCPICASGNQVNRDKIWNIDDMDADHISAWSKGGKTNSDNCEVLCKSHNRAKGNK